MPYREFLQRLRGRFKSKADPHLEEIRRALRKRRIAPAAQPMSDQELARAIREFQSSEISASTRQKLTQRLTESSRAASSKPAR